MKPKLVLLLLLSLILSECFAIDGITVNITSLNSPFNTCVNDTFRVRLINNSSGTLLNVDLGINFDNDVSYETCSLAVSRDTAGGVKLFRIDSLLAGDSAIF